MTTPLNPRKYVGTNQYLTPNVTRNRQPTTADLKQPETGANYPLTCLWQVGKSPTTGTEGEIFVLTKIVANLAYWEMVTGATGTVTSLEGDTGGVVGPDPSGVINILGTSGQITVTGDAPTNTLTLALANGGTPIDSFIPDAGTSPVVPTAAGVVTMIGGNGVLTTGGTNQLTFDMQSPFTGDFTFTKSTAAATETLTASNTDNTGASASSAAIVASVGGTTQTGDPYFSSVTGTARSYAWGSDTTDSQKLKINTTNAATATPSSGTNLWTMTSTGARTMPLQPCFLAKTTALVSNVTGDGTVYTMIFETEITDQASNYDPTTGIFTAPVTGIYFFTSQVHLGDIAAGQVSCAFQIATTARSFLSSGLSPIACADGAAHLNLAVNCVAPMTAGDTAIVQVAISGGAKTVDILAVAQPETFFAGYLIA